MRILGPTTLLALLLPVAVLAADAGKQGTAAPAAAAVAAAPVAEAPAASATPAAAAEAPATAPAAAAAAPIPADVEEEAESPLTPFYSFHFGEGVQIPNIGGFFFGNNIGTAIGGKYALGPAHTLFGSYELKYDGPGMRPQEGREFKERSIDHSISVGHGWKLSPALELGSRIQYLHEFRRSGANEDFGNGLYDFWSLGLAERLDLGIVKGVPLGAGIAYAYVRFPNYTDLLQEFQSASITSEISGGLQDYHRIKVDTDAQFGGGLGSAWLSVSMMSFVKAKVITSAGTQGGENQMDMITDLGGAWKFTLSKNEKSTLTAEPSLALGIKTSNQNFVRFRYFGDPAPSFIAGNYDYVSPSLNVPVRWKFAGGKSLFFAPSYTIMAYVSRPPRDTANNYVDGKKQMNQTLLLSLGYTSQFYAYSAWTFGYTVQVQKSNNRFERFLPYNYTGHIVYTAIDITY